MPPSIPPRSFGGALWGTALTSTSTHGLAGHLELLAKAFPSPVVQAIVGQLQPGQWQASRSAIGSLRREGNKALVAVPAIIAWMKRSDPRVRDEGHQYALREAANGLVDWRRQGRSLAPGADAPVRAALEHVLGIIDREGEAVAIALLSPRHSRAVRGAVHFLRDATGDPEAAISALTSFLEAPLPPGDDGDLAYTRAEAISALQELGKRLPPEEPVLPPHAPQEVAPAPVERSPASALPFEPERFVDEQLLPLLLHELGHGSLPVRRAALSGLMRLGRVGVQARPALWEICQRRGTGDDGWESFRQQALRQLVDLSTRQLAPTGEAVEPYLPEGLDRALRMAHEDEDPSVRAAAVQALGELPPGTPGVREALVGAFQDEAAEVRSAALRAWGARL